MVRWILEIDSDFNVPVKVEITDSQYGGSPISVKGGGSSIQRTFSRKNSDPYEKIKSGRVTVRLAGKKGDYEDLFARDLGRFKIKLYIDNQLDCEYIPLPDTFVVPDVQNEEFGTFTVDIQAANLRVLEQKNAWEVLEVDEDDPGFLGKTNAIIKIIRSLFDVNVVDGSVFLHSNGSASLGAMKQERIQLSRLEGLNAYQALEMIIPDGHQIRMTKGKAFVFSPSEASFTGREYNQNGQFVSENVYNENFTVKRLGRVLDTNRDNQRTYDGVRRIYDPLEGENAVPNGDFNPEDFGIEQFEGQSMVVEQPLQWQRLNYPGGLETRLHAIAVGGSRFAWQIPESVGNAAQQQATGLVPAVWRTTSKQVLAGQRLLIRLTTEYQSNNRTAVFPIVVRVGNRVLRKAFNVVGEPQWQTTTNSIEFDALEMSMTANGGYVDREFLSPPVENTGTLTIEIATPTIIQSGGWSEDNFLRISQIAIDPADENGDVLVRDEILAGSKGDVYEYTAGFGGGFTAFNPGALFSGENVISNWRYTGNDTGFTTDSMPIGELSTKYLFTQLSRDLDRTQGAADVYDVLALINDKRVNYMDTDFHRGRSDVELVQIRDHDIEATIEKRREKGTGVFVGGGGTPFPPDLVPFLQAIGQITRDYENEETNTLDCLLDQPLRKGIEYWVVNESELSRINRFAGVYAVIPQTTDSEGNRLLPDDENYDDETNVREYGPGLIEDLPIQEQTINAPTGSLIFIAPGQSEIEQNIGNEKDEEFDERIIDLNEELDQLDIDLAELDDALEELNTITLPGLQDDLDELESDLNTLNTVTLPALQNELDDNTDALNTLNAVTLPALESDLNDNTDALNTLNTVTLPNLQAELDDVLPITETKISDNAISAPKLQANSVIAGKIAANAVVANSIAANAVTANKINAGAVIADKISAGAVIAEKIATDAVTANKINAGAVVADKIATDAVTANKIAANAVIANKIQAGAVIAGKIGADAIVANNIAADAVTTNKILAGAITTNKIGAAQVTAAKIDVNDLAANSAFIVELMAQNLTIVSSGKITNTAEDFMINSDGFSVQRASFVVGGSIPARRSYRVENSSGNPIAGFFGDTNNNGYLTAPGNDRELRLVAGTPGSFPEQSPGSNAILEATDKVRLLSRNDLEMRFNGGDALDFRQLFNTSTIGGSESGYILVRINGNTRGIKLWTL